MMHLAFAILLLVQDEPSLLDAYRTAPQGYPRGADARGVPYAQPDLSSFFRWHFHNDSLPRAEDAAMDVHEKSYNPLEGEGVSRPEKHAAETRFVPEHATEGSKALRIEFAAAAVEAGKAAVLIQECVGPSYSPGWSPTRFHVAAYWCHYRWLKFDAFNPGTTPVRLTVNRVPLVFPPGPSVAAVRTADAVGWTNYACGIVNQIELRPAPDSGAVTLFVDHVRMEQEVPRTLSRKGRLFHFAVRSAEMKQPGAQILWPGFTAVERDTLYDPKTGFGWTLPPPAKGRDYHGDTFRSNDNGFIWGRASSVDAPLRVDLPKGRYGVWFLPFAGAGWGELIHADDALSIAVNGRSLPIRAALSGAERHRHAWAGEAWDWRPGSSLWNELVWPLSAGPDPVHYVDNTEGHLTFEFPWARALILFPEADKEAALRELVRFNALLADSWDVSHALLKGAYCRDKGYLGAHEEAWAPEVIPAKVRALSLTAADYRRGFVLFDRPLSDPFYPDTIPGPSDLKSVAPAAVAAPGMSDCVTFAILPLGEVKGVKVSCSGLPARVDVRVSRFHQKTMEEGHHNHGYSLGEHYLVRRPALDLYPGAARRVYLDVTVPPDATPGVYTGVVSVGDQTVPIRLEVPAVRLGPSPFQVISEKPHPELERFGFTTSMDSFKKEELPRVLSMTGQPYYSHEWQEGRKIPNGPATPETLEELRRGRKPPTAPSLTFPSLWANS